MSATLRQLLPAFAAVAFAAGLVCAPAAAQDADDAPENDTPAQVEGDTPDDAENNPPAEQPAMAKQLAGDYQRPVMIRVEGPIMPMLRKSLERKLADAQSREADLVILEITSPGGTVEDSVALAEQMLKLDWAHTAAYVPNQALSGATFLALGCEDIIMAPRAKLGDAGPIYLDEGFMFRHVPEKFRSDLVRTVRDLAEASDRPATLVEAMVDTDTLVYRYKNARTGETAYLSETDVAGREDRAQWEQGPLVPESREGLFLEVNGRRAVELGLADAVAADVDALKKLYGIEGRLPVLERTALDTIVYVLNLSVVTWLIFVVGLIAIYVEASSPGIGIGGLVAGLCFALFFWSRFLGGTAGWLELTLFIVGVGFLLMELLVVPGFGVAGIAGILLLVISLLLAGQASGLPETRRDVAALASSLMVLAASGVTVAIAGYFLSRNFGMIPVASRLMLGPPDFDREEGSTAAGQRGGATTDGETTPGSGTSAGDAGPIAVGTRGLAHTPLRPAGKGRFGDRFVNVVTDSEFVRRGQRIEVMGIDGADLVVRPVDE